LVANLGAAPSVSWSQAKRITVFLVRYGVTGENRTLVGGSTDRRQNHSATVTKYWWMSRESNSDFSGAGRKCSLYHYSPIWSGMPKSNRRLWFGRPGHSLYTNSANLFYFGAYGRCVGKLTRPSVAPGCCGNPTASRKVGTGLGFEPRSATL
jgi:hypothetical protein